MAVSSSLRQFSTRIPPSPYLHLVESCPTRGRIMTIQARRHNPRVFVNGTTYLNFSSGAGGVVLDISQGGLRFKTSSPLRNAESVDFRFTFSDGGELIADLAWTDDSRTVGALQFK